MTSIHSETENDCSDICHVLFDIFMLLLKNYLSSLLKSNYDNRHNLIILNIFIVCNDPVNLEFFS